MDPAGQSFRYSYDQAGTLASVTYPDGTTRTYHYEDKHDPHNLTGITDEKGLRYATYAYDDRDRAVLSKHANDAGKVTLAYADHAAILTNSLGGKTRYSLDRDHRIVAVTGPGCSTCGESDVRYGYNAQGQLTQITRPTNTRRLDYDRPGRLIEISETSEHRRSLIKRYEYGDPRHPYLATLVASPSAVAGKERTIRIRYNDQARPVELSEHYPGVKISFRRKTVRYGPKRADPAARIVYAPATIPESGWAWGHARRDGGAVNGWPSMVFDAISGGLIPHADASVPENSPPSVREQPIEAVDGASSNLERLDTLLEGEEGARVITVNEPAANENTLPPLAASEPAGATAPCTPTNEQRCDDIAAGIEYGELSQCVCRPETCDDSGEWTVIAPESIGLKKIDFEEDSFHAYLLQDKLTGAYVLSFRGTDDLVDWADNLGQQNGVTTAQCQRAIDLAAQLKKVIPGGTTVTVTGHSLGGGLATAAALKLKTEAVVFNPAGLHPDVAQKNDLNYADAAKSVALYHIEGEILTTVQDWEPINLPFDALPLITLDAPSAPGQRIALPPPDDAWVLAHTDTSPLLPTNVERGLTLHSMAAVLESLNAESRRLGCDQDEAEAFANAA